MARPRKRWSCSVGRYGSTVRLYEPRLGAPLRWDWRDDAGRQRPELDPPLRVRDTASSAVDPRRERAARALCERKAALLFLPRARADMEPERLTLGEAYALYFDPRRRALPKAKSSRRHHEYSRQFWERELGVESEWETLKPADVRGALIRMRESGRVATAAKLLQNLRTLARWLVEGMDLDVRDPARGVSTKQITEGYEPARPRYSEAEVRKVVKHARKADPRFRLFMELLADSGARSGQVRFAMRSGLDVELEPAVPDGYAPHGWLLLPGVKRQRPMLVYLTERQRAEIDAAIGSYLATWEAEWEADGADYPLIPGGRLTNRGRLDMARIEREAVSYETLWGVLKQVETAAGVEQKPKRAFHGLRRAWADITRQEIGSDAAAAAGGWSRRETFDNIYVSPIKHADLKRAREAREARGDGE